MKIKVAQFHHIVLLTGLNYWKNWSLQEEGRCLGFLVGCPQWDSKHWEGLNLLILSITKWSLFLVFTRFPSYLKTPLSFLFRWFDFTLNPIFLLFLEWSLNFNQKIIPKKSEHKHKMKKFEPPNYTPDRENRSH